MAKSHYLCYCNYNTESVFVSFTDQSPDIGIFLIVSDNFKISTLFLKHMHICPWYLTAFGKVAHELPVIIICKYYLKKKYMRH